MCDEIIDTTETKNRSYKNHPKNKYFNKKHYNKVLYFTSIFVNYVALIAVSIYCFFIKYQAKQKHSLRCYYTINDLKEIGY